MISGLRPVSSDLRRCRTRAASNRCDSSGRSRGHSKRPTCWSSCRTLRPVNVVGNQVDEPRFFAVVPDVNDRVVRDLQCLGLAQKALLRGRPVRVRCWSQQTDRHRMTRGHGACRGTRHFRVVPCRVSRRRRKSRRGPRLASLRSSSHLKCRRRATAPHQDPPADGHLSFGSFANPLRHDIVDPLRQVGTQRSDAWRRSRELCRHDRQEVSPIGERQLSRQHLEEDSRQAVDVGAAVHGPPGQLFRRRVGDGSRGTGEYR